MACKKARLEAIERHLLLKSFCQFGWKGFSPLKQIQSDEISLQFLISRYKTQDLAAGLIVAQSPKFKGVSFGYTVGALQNVDSADFWQGALFEAVDKLLILDPNEVGPTPGQSWIRRENDRFLIEDLSLNELKFSSERECH